MAWQEMGKRRAELVVSKTGFLSLGPYRKSICGFDVDTSTGNFTARPSSHLLRLRPLICSTETARARACHSALVCST